MKTRIFLFNIDLFFQGILFFGAILFSFLSIVSGGGAIFLLMYNFLFLGAWQLASGLLTALLLNDEKRFKYFFGSLAYLFVMYAFGHIGFGGLGYFSIALIILFVGLIPLRIAYWYLKFTNQTIINLKNKTLEEKYSENEMEDILDSDEILRHKI